MLDIELVQARPALKVEFRFSLAEDLLHTLSLVTDAPHIEGLDQWVYATHAALPPTLKHDMEPVLVLIQKSDKLSLWTHQLSPDDPAHRDFSEYIAWLNGFTEGDYRGLIQNTIEILAHHCRDESGEPLPTPSLSDDEALNACLGQKLAGEQLERAIHLAQNPSELKAQFISVTTRFWEQFYAQEYPQCLPLMQRSVVYHSHRNYSADFDTVFSAVTGRRPLQDHGSYDDVERVIFVPSCHIGPYVMIHHIKEPQPTLILHYNCRPTGAPEHEESPAIQDLFPPLKALSDETRLQILSLLDGRELYAQEIVEQLDISQSAVSRHLKLMSSGGLLNIRREDSMKYYSINRDTLVAVADRLKGFRGKPGA
jgi:DNA-binding transcriptional ArsR family regulator